jgi:hypothetical protein
MQNLSHDGWLLGLDLKTKLDGGPLHCDIWSFYNVRYKLPYIVSLADQMVLYI